MIPFVPYRVDRFIRSGSLVSVPRFKPQGKVKQLLYFPYVDSIGQMLPQHVFIAEVRLDYFIHCLAHTVYNRLYAFAVRHGKWKKTNISEYLLQYSYLMVITPHNYDSNLSRILAMLRHGSRILKRFVFSKINKLPDTVKVFLRACLCALTRRSPWHHCLGDKGSSISDYTKGCYQAANGVSLKVHSDYLRGYYGLPVLVSDHERKAPRAGRKAGPRTCTK